MGVIDFWEWFKLHSRRLVSQSDRAGTVDEIVEQLQKGIDRISVEIDADLGQPRELVFTVGGDANLFADVQHLVSAAPALPEWQFVALKPARGFGFSIQLSHGTLRPWEWGFVPLESADIPSELGILLVLPGDCLIPDPDLIDIIVQTGVGESASSYIRHLESTVNPPAYAEVIDLPKLGDYLAWHKKRYSEKSNQN